MYFYDNFHFIVFVYLFICLRINTRMSDSINGCTPMFSIYIILLQADSLQVLFSAPQPMLPIGLSDVPGEAMVKLYCPKCCDVYTPKSSRHHHIDGAYFGTGFPHMLFMVHPEYRPKRPTNQFVPRLYGFKIHPMAYQIQQQSAASFKAPMRAVNYNNGKR